MKIEVTVGENKLWSQLGRHTNLNKIYNSSCTTILQVVLLVVHHNAQQNLISTVKFKLSAMLSP